MNIPWDEITFCDIYEKPNEQNERWGCVEFRRRENAMIFLKEFYRQKDDLCEKMRLGCAELISEKCNPCVRVKILCVMEQKLTAIDYSYFFISIIIDNLEFA